MNILRMKHKFYSKWKMTHCASDDNLCLRWHIWRNYHFVRDVTFKETRNINSFTALLKSFAFVALVQQLVKLSKLVEIDKANCFTWKRHFKMVFILQQYTLSFLDVSLPYTDFSARLILKDEEKHAIFLAISNKH